MIIGLAAGLLVALVLLFFKKTRQNGNWLLGVSVLAFWYALLTTYIYQSELIVDYPHFSRTGNLYAFLITPMLYVFTRYIFYRDRQWNKTDWVIFLPFVFYLIDFWPYFMLSASEKVGFITNNQLATNNFKFAEGWLTPPWFQFYTRQFWSLVFLVLSMRILWINRNIAQGGVTRKNKKIFILISVLTILYSITFVPAFSRLFTDSAWYTLEIQGVTGTITLVVLALFLLFNPDFLYGFFCRLVSLISKKNNSY